MLFSEFPATYAGPLFPPLARSAYVVSDSPDCRLAG